MIFALTCIMLLTGIIPVVVEAEPVTSYMYFSKYEVTRFNEIIWFWATDTLYGRIRSNDFIAIGNNFFGVVYAPGVRWIGEGEPNFEIIICPPFCYPRSYPHIRQQANIRISGHERFMTRIRMRGNQGIDVYQYPIGIPPIDSLVFNIPSPPHRQIMFVDGQVEVEGVLNGQLTIYSSGNMWLLDNVIYEGSNPRTGWFEEEGMHHMLGLVSEGNIIIKNDTLNGRGDGWNQGRGDFNRHSIAINGSLVALGESFTFEHQNDEWEAYCGPSPDERGYIYLKGSIAQWRRGHLHRSNHIGTGYGKSWNYDFRLDSQAPPGFGAGEIPDVSGYYPSMMLVYGPYTFRNAQIDTLIVQPGVEMILDGMNALTVRDSLLIRGTEAAPVTVRTRHPRSRSTFSAEWGRYTKGAMRHATFSEGVEIRFDVDSLFVDSCRFDGPVSLDGNVHITASWFSDRLSLTSWGQVRLSRSVLQGGIVVSGNVRDGLIENNTIIGGRFAGVEISRFNRLRLVNNIIAFNRAGIVNDHHEQPQLEYNNVYGNRDDDFVNCRGGEGSISLDPLFVNVNRDNYQLAWGSSCIDAGDPDSPLDPDGSRADIGRYAFHHELGMKPEVEPVGEFQISVMPNPFNRSASLVIQAPQTGVMEIVIYNIRGRVIVSQEIRIERGSQRIELDGKTFGAPGVYLARVTVENYRKDLKLVYLP